MIQAELNIFDMVVLGVLGLSAIIAFFRGFVREVLSLGAWIGAIVITLYFFPSVAEYIKPHISNDGVASGIAGMATFIGSLIGLSIVNAFLMKFLKTGSEIGIIDNALGLVFGVARGLLLVSIGFYVMSFFFGDEYPEWMEGSKTQPYVEEVAGWIASMAPEYLGDKDGQSKLKPKKEGPISDMLESLPAPKSGTIFEADGLNDAPARLPNNQAAEERRAAEQREWPSMKELRERVKSE